jgi:SAM-dependent methyltransferase
VGDETVPPYLLPNRIEASQPTTSLSLGCGLPTAGLKTSAGSGDPRRNKSTVDKLPFGDADFDKAMTMYSVLLWPDPVVGLREVRRTLRSGGRIAVAITRFLYTSPDKLKQHLIDSSFIDVSVHPEDPRTCAVGRA